MCVKALHRDYDAILKTLKFLKDDGDKTQLCQFFSLPRSGIARTVEATKKIGGVVREYELSKVRPLASLIRSSVAFGEKGDVDPAFLAFLAGYRGLKISTQ